MPSEPNGGTGHQWFQQFDLVIQTRYISAAQKLRGKMVQDEIDRLKTTKSNRHRLPLSPAMINNGIRREDGPTVSAVLCGAFERNAIKKYSSVMIFFSFFFLSRKLLKRTK